MLKLLFGLLLFANGALFAYHKGYLHPLIPTGHEPDRMEKQFNTDKIKVIPTNAIAGSIAPVAPVAPKPEVKPAPVPVQVVDNNVEIACMEIGNFDLTEAKRFEALVITLPWSSRLSKYTVQETARHMVFIPSLGTKEAADKKAGELRRFGIKDFYIIQDGTEFQWGISLGVFKVEEAARAHLAALAQKGVRSAKIGAYNTTSSKVVFQLRDLDTSARAALNRVKSNFPQQELRGCAVAPAP